MVEPRRRRPPAGRSHSANGNAVPTNYYTILRQYARTSWLAAISEEELMNSAPLLLENRSSVVEGGRGDDHE